MPLKPQGRIFNDITETMGGTPLVRINRLVPKDHAGLGATAVEAVQVQRAIGSRAPSVAVAVTMHHYSIATFMAFLAATPESTDWLAGGIVMPGAVRVGSTVSTATALVTAPMLLVMTTRKFAESLVWTLARLSAEVVAPVTLPLSKRSVPSRCQR